MSETDQDTIDNRLRSIFRGVVKSPRPKRRSRRHRHSAFYETYMQSEEWKTLRETMINITEGCCERCDATEDTVILEVHHLTYERLGREDLDDLEVLCPACHAVADVERAEEARTDLEYRRLAGWATKVYGSNWKWNPGYSEAEEAFEEWLERRS